MSPDNEIPFYAQTAFLDRYIHATDLSVDPVAVDAIVQALRSEPNLRDYFFRSGPSAAWAPILWEQEFFAAAPQMEQSEEGSFLRSWDVQYYLISVASQVPDIVIKHVETLEANGWYLAQAIRALAQIPAAEAGPALPRVIGWLKNPKIASDIAFAAGELCEKLVKDGQVKAALQIFRELTSPRVVPAGVPNFDRSLSPNVYINSTLDLALGSRRKPSEILDVLIRDDAPAIIQVLETHLTEALDLEFEKSDRPEGKSSFWWRSAIEDTDQDRDDTYKEKVLRALRDAAERWAQADAQASEGLIQRYLEEPHSILRRVGLHVLWHYPALYPRLVPQELLRRDNFDDYEIRHEFFMLLQHGFPQLPPDERRAVLDLIVKGPRPTDAQEHAENVLGKAGQDKDDFVALSAKRWVRDRLWMVQENLEGDSLVLLKGLVSEIGAPAHPAFSTWSSGFWVREVSPFPEEELLRLSPEQLLEALSGWQPSGRERWGPEEVSFTGLASATAKIVLADLEKYAGHLDEIACLRPEYANAILDRWAHVQGTPIPPWPEVIHLCEALLANPAVNERPVHKLFEESWLSVRINITRLLETAFANENRLISDQYFEQARNILVALSDDADPDLEADRPPENYAGYQDPLTVSLNHVRPLALRALVSYAVHRARRQLQADYQGSRERIEAVVRQTLEKRLDRRLEPSRAVRAVYGEMLPKLYWLDKDWVRENLNRIFPPPGDEEDLWLYVSAWDAFVLNPYYFELGEDLKPYYHRAIENAGRGKLTKTHLPTTQQLAKHLALAYMHADYPITSPEGRESLIMSFFNQTPPEIRKDGAWAIWRIYQDNPADQAKNWARARAFWEARLQEAISQQYSPDFKAEMEQFALLLPSAPSTETFASLQPLLEGLWPYLSLTTHLNTGWLAVEKYLARSVEVEPLRTIRFYRRMHTQSQPPQWFHASEESRKIFETAAQHPEAKQEAFLLNDQYMRWGIYDYRDIFE